MNRAHLYVCSMHMTHSQGCTDLASLVFSDEDVPGSQVSVDKGLTAEVVHTPGHLHTELSQQSCRVRLRWLSRTV